MPLGFRALYWTGTVLRLGSAQGLGDGQTPATCTTSSRLSRSGAPTWLRQVGQLAGSGSALPCMCWHGSGPGPGGSSGSQPSSPTLPLGTPRCAGSQIALALRWTGRSPSRAVTRRPSLSSCYVTQQPPASGSETWLVQSRRTPSGPQVGQDCRRSAQATSRWAWLSTPRGTAHTVGCSDMSLTVCSVSRYNTVTAALFCSCGVSKRASCVFSLHTPTGDSTAWWRCLGTTSGHVESPAGSSWPH